MKLEDSVIVAKFLCYIVIGGLTPLATGLTQWVNDGSWPPKINWVVIIAGCCVGAATQALAFLSQAFKDWKDQKTVDSGGTVPLLTKKPEAETKG